MAQQPVYLPLRGCLQRVHLHTPRILAGVTRHIAVTAGQHFAHVLWLLVAPFPIPPFRRPLPNVPQRLL